MKAQLPRCMNLNIIMTRLYEYVCRTHRSNVGKEVPTYAIFITENGTWIKDERSVSPFYFCPALQLTSWRNVRRRTTYLFSLSHTLINSSLFFSSLSPSLLSFLSSFFVLSPTFPFCILPLS